MTEQITEADLQEAASRVERANAAIDNAHIEWRAADAALKDLTRRHRTDMFQHLQIGDGLKYRRQSRVSYVLEVLDRDAQIGWWRNTSTNTPCNPDALLKMFIDGVLVVAEPAATDKD